MFVSGIFEFDFWTLKIFYFELEVELELKIELENFSFSFFFVLLAWHIYSVARIRRGTYTAWHI